MTGMTAPKIMWVKANEPEIFKRVKKIMLPKDYLIYKLSGIFASDVSDLSGTLFNPATRSYSQEMLKILGITESTLPKVYESYRVVGLLKDDIRLDLGITNEVKIIAGGGDQPVGAIGTGIVDDGVVSVSLGTSGVIFVASEKFRVDHQSHFQSRVHASGDYLVMAVMLNAAGTIKWWNEVINDNIDYAAFYDAVETGNPDESLFFLPYLSGERAPINDPYAKGVMFGLASHHQKKDLDRAILEGVTFALKQSFLAIKDLGIPITSVRLTGGGAKSDLGANDVTSSWSTSRRFPLKRSRPRSRHPGDGRLWFVSLAKRSRQGDCQYSESLCPKQQKKRYIPKEVLEVCQTVSLHKGFVSRFLFLNRKR